MGKLLLFSVKSLMAVLTPLEVHLTIVLLYELLDDSNFTGGQLATMLKLGIPIRPDKELRGARFRQPTITGVDVHALNDAKRGEI